MHVRVLVSLLFLASSLSGGGCANTGHARLASTSLTDADLALGAADDDMRSSGGFNETVRMTGVLEGGGSIYGRLVVTNLAMANQQARLQLSIAPSGKAAASIRLRRKKGQWKARRGALNFEMPLRGTREASLAGRVGEMLWTGKSKGTSITVKVTSSTVPMALPGGSADFGNDKFYRTTLVIPHGRLSALVTLAGGDGQEPTSYRVKGWVSVEKRTGNVAPYAMAKRFIDVRHVDAEGLFALSGFQRSSQYGGRTQGWLVMISNGQASVTIEQLGLRTQSVERHEKSGYNVPKLVHFWDLTTPNLRGVVKAGRLVRVFDDLGSLSKLERAIAERFARPWTFRFDAHWALRATDGRKWSGSAYYSYNQLN